MEQDLEDDRDQLQAILNEVKVVDSQRDMKLQTLWNLIQDKFEHPINPGNKKIIIFTAFADTANYLYDNLAPHLQDQGILYRPWSPAAVITSLPCPFQRN